MPATKRKQSDDDFEVGGREGLNRQKAPFASTSIVSLTPEERAQWNGFCEIESEPAFFNVMLREFGVKGAKVEEVISLDEEMLGFLQKPIYGLIFLFRWKEDDPHKQEMSCPEHIWFANQTSDYACASVALLNIVNNAEGLELGEELKHFKEFTKTFTPALRGIAINNFEFVKRVHNSFARKMDILSVDLQLRNEANEKRRPSKSTSNSDEEESESGFHFIAFVPVQGELWKFDGLERQPQNLGRYEGEWLNLATPEIQARMAEYEEDQIEFSVLSLAKDPLIDLRAQLCSNIASLVAIDAHLSQSGVELDSLEEGTLTGPDASYGVTQSMLDDKNASSSIEALISSKSSDQLIRCRAEFAQSQRGLRASITEEEQSRKADEEYAAQRRHDYRPPVEKWLRILAQKGNIERLVAETTVN